VLVHSPVARRAAANGAGAYDFAPMFAPIAGRVGAADLALCHLETPLARDSGPLSYYPTFSVPGTLATALVDAGYDACSTASNHALDRGVDGVASTLERLDAVGLGHTGTARSAAEAAAPRLYRAAGVTVGHLSYTYGFNGFSPPADAPWAADRIDVPRIVADAARVREAGAEFTVVSLHWGVEFNATPTPEQQQVGRAVLASPDVDLLVGHHAHVVQPVERIGDEYVVYGMGNLLSNQSAACCPAASQDGVLVTATVVERTRRPGFRVARVSLTPTMVERGSYRVIPTPDALADPATPPALRSALDASHGRTVATMTSLGVPGVVVG
jgi:poly-gamma-glutamate capsule biosynthesis protein CapA/YwtB (metallophosphatase superfamily)